MYKIVYHPWVFKKDFKTIPRGDLKKIKRTIEEKLTTRPEIFGKPLLGKLSHYYRLRIGHYRLVYRIEKQRVIVYVLHVGVRRDFLVYMESARRLGLL